jgi:hypothetical protein
MCQQINMAGERLRAWTENELGSQPESQAWKFLEGALPLIDIP